MPPRSLSMSAYRALAGRGQPAGQDFDTARPEGSVVWIHLGHVQDLTALLDLVDRLVNLREGLNALVTMLPRDSMLWGQLPDTDTRFMRAVPDEHPRSVRAFLDHWRPDVGLWMWGGLRPTLVEEAARSGIPLHLVSAESQGFEVRRNRWLPDLSRHLISSFRTASVRDELTAQRLARLGMPEDRIAVQPPLRPTGQLLPCTASDLDDLSDELAGRPVWLAAQCEADEYDIVLQAHHMALRSAHRLLLVLEPTDSDTRPDLLETIDRHEFSRAVWSDGEWPDASTQVLVADQPGERGLWYRLATVSFLGGSLTTGHGGTEPMAAAALGTAILHGPNMRRYMLSYSRLGKAGAARVVKDAASLGSAVTCLIAPDHAAAMAHAGWDVVSEGAEAVDSVIAVVRASLDSQSEGAGSR